MIRYRKKDFDINNLGSFYFTDKTIFRVFAPEYNEVFIYVDDNKYSMSKDNYTFELILGGNHELSKYYYESDTGVKFLDPFAYYCDHDYSYVLDTNKFDSETIKPKENTDVIIYETNVRDFSCDDSFVDEHKRKLLALALDNLKIKDYFSIGLDYVKQLGITYLQLMPIFDYDNDHSDYNWGYNPLAFNYIKPDYIEDNTNPYAYVNELRSVVNILHQNNIRLSLDVVFNHVYNTSIFDLNKMLPGHCFRKKSDGSLAQGTFCGNEIKTEDIFLREYFALMVTRYIELFDIDGIRMDLMGILTYEVVNYIKKKANEIKSDFIVYGEGWNMGDVIAIDKRASLLNAHQIPEIGMFNDLYRDTITNYVLEKKANIEDVKRVLGGNSNNLRTSQSINYVECHDGYTFFDRVCIDRANDDFITKVKRCKLALALVVLSRGIPFIHSGQEFLRSKYGNKNSYNLGESVNKLDWNRRVQFNDVSDYLKDLIYVRKNNPEFTKTNCSVKFIDYYECLIYCIDDLMIIINPCVWDHIYKDGNSYYNLLNYAGKCDSVSNVISIPAFSLVVLRKVKK